MNVHSAGRSAAEGPTESHVHLTGVCCPHCAMPLYQAPGALHSQGGRQLRCMRCHANWEYEPQPRDDDWLWLIVGTWAVFVASTVASALWVSANSTCIEVVRDGSPLCAVKPSMLGWIHPMAAASVAVIVAVSAAVLIPLVTGRRVLRGYWWHLALWAFVLGMLVGAGSGLWLTERYAADQFWSNPALGTQLGYAAFAAAVTIWTIGVIVTRKALRDQSRWRLTQIFPDLKEGHSGRSTNQSHRIRIFPGFYDPVPYTPKERSDS